MIHLLSAQVSTTVDDRYSVWEQQIGFSEPRVKVHLELQCSESEARELLAMLRGGRVASSEEPLALTSGAPQLPSGPVVYDAEEIE